jgi:hypothetical protein
LPAFRNISRSARAGHCRAPSTRSPSITTGRTIGQKLAADTQKNRRRVIERCRAQHGDKRVPLLQREHILGMLAAPERPSAKQNPWTGSAFMIATVLRSRQRCHS